MKSAKIIWIWIFLPINYKAKGGEYSSTLIPTGDGKTVLTVKKLTFKGIRKQFY